MNTNRSIDKRSDKPYPMKERKPDEKRGGIAFAFLIILGLAIGFLIKRVHYGLLLGLALGLLSSGFLRKR